MNQVASVLAALGAIGLGVIFEGGAVGASGRAFSAAPMVFSVQSHVFGACGAAG